MAEEEDEREAYSRRIGDDRRQYTQRQNEDRDAYSRRVRDERRELDDKLNMLITLFRAVGVDPGNQDDITRLRDNLLYAERQRRRYERFENNRFGWIVSFICMAVGAMLTSLIPQWFNRSGH